VDYVLQDVGLAEHKDDAAAPTDLDAVTAGIRSHLDDVVAELHAPMSYATQMCSGASVGTLLLTGLGAGIPGADAHFRSRVDAGVWTVAPGDLLPASRRVGGTPGDPALTVAVGLAQFDE
jgi:Tfp pilus assembly PilM family ATPase